MTFYSTHRFRQNRKKLVNQLHKEVTYFDKYKITYDKLLKLYYEYKGGRYTNEIIKKALDFYLMTKSIRPLDFIIKEHEENKRILKDINKTIEFLQQDVKELYQMLKNCQELVTQNREDYDIIETNMNNKLQFLNNLLKDAPRKKRSSVVTSKSVKNNVNS